MLIFVVRFANYSIKFAIFFNRFANIVIRFANYSIKFAIFFNRFAIIVVRFANYLIKFALFLFAIPFYLVHFFLVSFHCQSLIWGPMPLWHGVFLLFFHLLLFLSKSTCVHLIHLLPSLSKCTCVHLSLYSLHPLLTACLRWLRP